VSVAHEPFDTFAALHAVGALDGEDLRAFETHLTAGCARCATLVRQTEQALARAAMAGPPEPPPAEVREALVRRAAEAASPARRRWVPLAAAVVAAGVTAGALSMAFVASRYEARLEAMARETGAVRERLARGEAELRDFELLRDPTARVVELRGLAGGPAAAARVVWTDRAGGLLVAMKLPPAPAGKTYALWILEGGALRGAGAFVPDEAGRATLRVAAAATGAPVRVLSVTLEPAGIPGAPTGAVVLVPR
jgi:hypothetical protein